MPDFLPRRQVEFLHWSANFDRHINLAPQDYGLAAQQAAEYSQLHAAFAQAYRIANDPSTGGKSAVAGKDMAEVTLRKHARQLAGIIRAQPGVNDQQRIALGLKQRRRRPTRIGRPEHAPRISIDWPIGRAVTVYLRDAQRPRSKAKPKGVDHAVIFSFVGEYPPALVKDWRIHAMATCNRKTLFFDWRAAPLPGTKVWITARWESPRGEAGPIAPPVFTYIGFAGFAAPPPGAADLALAS